MKIRPWLIEGVVVKPRLSTLPTRLPPATTSRVRPPPKQAAPFYVSPAWRRLIAEIIRHRGRSCEDQGHDPAQPHTGIRIYGDHVIELRDGGAALDPRNIVLRCGQCHNRKTAAERVKRARSP